MNISINYEEGMIKKLRKLGFRDIPKKTPFEKLRLEKNCLVVLYNTGKLLLQGSDSGVLHTLSDLRGKKKQNKLDSEEEIIGSDETLKGDTFGGLIVSGFKGNSRIRSRLMSLGVKDSKLLSEQQILRIAEALEKEFPNRICIIELSPENYNHKMSYTSVTGLLNQMHQDVYNTLKPGKHVVDKYPGCKIGDEILEKAESKYLEVAAASIVARKRALDQFDRLSEKIGFTLPKGSTHVSDALRKLEIKGLNKARFVKTHFRNV